MRNLSALPLLVTFALSFVACLGVDDSVGRNLGLGAVCGASGDCAANLECEVEHGAASCQPRGGGDGGARSDAATMTPRVLACRVDTDCAAGLECEVEHGVGSCLPHGNTGASDAGTAAADAPTGRGVGGACAVDLDCEAGLECEVEHGVGTCEPHGGR